MATGPSGFKTVTGRSVVGAFVGRGRGLWRRIRRGRSRGLEGGGVPAVRDRSRPMEMERPSMAMSKRTSIDWPRPLPLSASSSPQPCSSYRRGQQRHAAGRWWVMLAALAPIVSFLRRPWFPRSQLIYAAVSQVAVSEHSSCPGRSTVTRFELSGILFRASRAAPR